MVRAVFYSVLATLLLAGACLLPARAQDASQTPAATPAAAGKSPAKKDAQAKPNAAQAAPAAASSGAEPAKQAEPKHSNAENNPFPEELSRSAAKAANAADAAPATDGVSSSRSGFEGSDPNLEAADAPAAPAREETTALHDPKRAAKDRDVGKFYFDSGDYVGAYNRLKGALAENPEDPEAAYYLAEAARKVNLTDEAVRNYQLVIDLDPEGRKAKAARKALAAIAADRRQ